MDEPIKCVIVGDSAEDKTSLLFSYTSNRFLYDYIPTVFENFALTLTVDNETYKLGLFDTAGQEDFDQLRPLGYTETDVFLVCYSVKAPTSLESVRKKWAPEISRCCPGTPFLLVGTNIEQLEDLELVEDSTGKLVAVEKSPFVSYAEGEKLAEELNAVKYMECSAVTREGLNAVFEEAVRAALHARKLNNNKGPVVNTKNNLKKCVIM